MIEITDVIKKCSKMNTFELTLDQKCKDYCIVLHNLVIWDDLVESYNLLGKVEFFIINMLV